MNVLLDTNIPGRMAEAGHSQQQMAFDAVAALVRRGDAPCLVPQVLYEFWVVATRPLTANGLAFTPSQAQAEIGRLEALYPLFPDTPAIYTEWKNLVAVTQVVGRSAHDARLAAAMSVHGITHILTFNAGHFSRFPGITVLDPAVVAMPPTSSLE
jgi:predicted nucleic acid-binding protein